MLIIEIDALENGAHRNQNGTFATIPDGWVEVPEGTEIPESFPFVDVEIDAYGRVILTPREVPQEPEESEVPEEQEE